MRRLFEGVVRLARSDAAFCIGLAAALVLVRYLVYDSTYFALVTVPNHDMSQGFAFFASSMHSMRETGEPAWWSPLDGGSAQYYQSFLSPLAPTTHHLVFLVWGQLIRLAATFGITVAEYRQYLVVNYTVLPFLAYAGWISLAMQLFRRRLTVALVAVVYAFSGIGLAQSAWFYFQEPATLNFLAAAYLALVHRPTPARAGLFAIAVVVQATSLNYWTVYNLLFLGVVLGAHAWMYSNQLRRAAVHLARSRSALACGLAALMTIAVWSVLTASIVREQSPHYVRLAYVAQGEGSGFRMDTVIGRTLEARHFTIEMFNPVIERSLQHYGLKNGEVNNPVHDARYLGCVLVPFLLVAGAMSWTRRERWLLTSTVGVFFICLASPPFALAWQAIPMMDRIQNLFLYAPNFLAQLVVLFAGCGLDAVLAGRFSEATRRRLVLVTGGLLALAIAMLVGISAISERFAYGDVALQANILAAILTIVPAAVLLQTLQRPTVPMRRFLGILCVLLAVADLTRYFRQVCTHDRAFTPHHVHTSSPLTGDQRRLLRRPFAPPDPALGFDAGVVDNAPIRNLFWPVNVYLVPKVRLDPTGTITLPAFDPVSTPAIGFAESLDGDVTGAGRILRWTWNDFELDATTPASGWIHVPQLHDRCWRANVDGERVKVEPTRNGVGMAIPVASGTHRITLEYRPLARSLYGPATWLTFGFIVFSLTIAWRAQPRERRGSSVRP